MPTLADYWRIKERRHDVRRGDARIVDFEGPEGPFDAERALEDKL